MALVCVVLCVLFDGTLKAACTPLGMPVGTLPFCLGAIVMMLTHGNIPGFEPVPIADVSTAEDHLVSTAFAPDDEGSLKTSRLSPRKNFRVRVLA